MRTKTLLLMTACVVTVGAAANLLTPGKALALNECGPVNTASNPQTATCTGAFNPYATGITYDENTVPVLSQGNVQINLSGTAAETTASDGVKVTGVPGLNATAQVLTGASVNAGVHGVYVLASGGGTATITTNGTVAATAIGLEAVSDSTGHVQVTNAGRVSVAGAGAYFGVFAANGVILNNSGTVTVDGTVSGNHVSGLGTLTNSASSTATVTNTGTVAVTGGSGDATGIGSGFTNAGSANYTNNGALTVTAGTGAAYGFQVIGGTDVSITDAQTAAGATTTSITGSHSLYGASVTGVSGTDAVNFTGIALTLSSTDATGVQISGGSNDTVNVSRTAFGATTYLADMSITGSNSATGVSVSNTSGPNAVAFSGANLSATGGAGGATGVALSGGQNGSVSFTPTTGSSTLTVHATGGTATGVSISGTGVVSTSLEGVSSITNTGGDATGVSAFGGTSASVTVARTTVGATTYLADMTVTGSGAANGVIASSSGANSATFTGAGLTVSGGTGSALGIQAYGGTDATVTMTPTGGAAALSVSTGGSYVEGAYINGTGVLTGAFGDTVSVTDTNGGVTGVYMNGGAAQTLTLSQGLTATATSGYARGAYLRGSGATTSTLHASGTITANGTGSGKDAVGVENINGGAFILDGAPTINVSGDGQTLGVYRNGGGGAVNVTTGAITASTTSAGAAVGGVVLGSTGAISVTDAGIIDVTGVGTDYGVYVAADGASGAVNLNLNTVRIHGAAAAGSGYGVLAENATTGSDLTTVTVQQITTTGQNLVGIAGYASANGAGTITVGTLAGHTGGVSTAGASAAGVTFSGGNGLLTITNNGLVSTTGANSPGISGSSSGTGGVTVNNWQVTTTSAGSPGLTVTTSGGAGTIVSNSVITTGGSGSGAISDTTNGGGASVTSTLASTTGTGSNAITTSSGSGATTIASTTATTTGATSSAINATSTTGAIGVTSITATTTGATSSAISATSTTGAIGITSAAATTGAASSPAIVAASTTGPITISATNTTATGGTSDAISATASSTGTVIVNLADGAATRSTGGNGVLVSTGGAATINVGSAANSTTVTGGLWGVNSTAALGTTLNIHGSVTGGGGAAINLAGGSDHVNNSGTINGYVTIVSTSDVFTNSGTWNAFGANSTFDPPGVNLLNNSGVININPNSTTAATYSFLAPGIPLTLNNSGTISLQQGAGGTPHTGDALNIGNALYTGSGGAQLLIDANLGNAAVGASGAQTADKLLVQTGSVAGSTSIGVRDLGAALPGAFNFTGIQVVAAGSSSAGAFSLAGGSINKGYVQYRLTQSGSNYYLVGLPSEAAFEVVRTGFEAQSYWRRSGDVWSDQMREDGFRETQGPTVWAQASYASDTQKSNPTYQVVALNTFTFTPDLDIDNQWSGAQFGIDFGKGHWGYGVTAGFGQQLGHFKADGDHLDLDGGNAGVYLRWEQDGLFFDALAKYDGYTVKQKNQLPLFEVDFNGSTVGAELQGGYRWTSGASFVEPAVSLSWTDSNLGSFNNAQAGAQVNFNHSESVYGNAGLRIGTTVPNGDWTVTPYAGAYVQGEMSGKNKVTITAGPNALTFADPRGGANGRFELGLSGHGKTGLEFSAAVDGASGGSLSGIRGRIGLAYHW